MTPSPDQPHVCLYAAGRCSHDECGAYAAGYLAGQSPTAPSVEDYCAGGGHAYAGDDMMDEDTVLGRCYCGHRTYPPGGPG